MTEIKTQHPFIESNGKENYRLIKFYAEDNKGIRYKVKNQQTGKILDEAVCTYPARFTYETTQIKCEIQPVREEEPIVEDLKKKKKREEIVETIEEEIIAPMESEIVENIEENKEGEEE